MNDSRRAEFVTKTKAVLARQRAIGWTRSEWTAQVVSALDDGFILFAKGRLAAKTGPRLRARARDLEAEFDRKLFGRMMGILVHRVRLDFDATAAFNEAVGQMPGTIERPREEAERDFAREIGEVRRGLDEHDVEMFWKRAGEAARGLT